MAKTKHPFLQLLLFFIVISAAAIPRGVAGSRAPMLPHFVGWKSNAMSSQEQEFQFQGSGNEEDSKRLMIGSVAPTCTYNECRGCKYKCKAEQVPVEGNDPIHSAYHYKCICHP